MNRRNILVINPNSNESVTAGLQEALAGWSAYPAIAIECVTLHEGPFGIETAEDILAVEPLLLGEIKRRDDCQAFVIGCYSDPGLRAGRAATGKPVFGMQQSAAAAAIAQGGRFGVLALSTESIARHDRYLAELGLDRHRVAEVSLDMSVDAAANHPDALQRIITKGRCLVDDYGASVIVLGCAGLARHRAAAARTLGVPVIEPVQAAVTQAIGALQ